jgi:nucleoside-diphosphate-sugar epimerase
MGELLHEALGTAPLLRFGVPFPVLRLASLGVEAYGKVSGKAVMLTREKVKMLSHHWVCDSRKTRADLDWAPEVPFPEGLRRTARWYQENGWL